MDHCRRTCTAKSAPQPAELSARDLYKQINREKFLKRFYAKAKAKGKRLPCTNFKPHADDESVASETSDVTSDSANSPESWMSYVGNLFREAADLEDTFGWHDMMSPLEDVVLLFGNLMGCDNPVSASCAVMTFIKARSGVVLSEEIYKCVSPLFSDDDNSVKPQSGESSSQEEKTKTVVSTGQKWTQALKGLRGNWSDLKNSSLFSHVSNLLGLVCLVGICDASNLTFKFSTFDVVRPRLFKEHSCCWDILDAILNSFVYFAENLTACVKERSIKPLIFGSASNDDLIKDYNDVQLWWSLLRNGNLDRVKGISESHFKAKLHEVSSRLVVASKELRGFEKRVIDDKLLDLLHIENEYAVHKMGSGIRAAPFVFEIFGPSNQGKSTIGATILDACLKAAGLPMGDQYRQTINGCKKFLDGMKSHKNAVMFDDWGNTKAEFVENPPTETLKDMDNNVPFVANMADLREKGKIFVEPELVGITTNVKHLDAHKYSNCPYSIQRRARYVITVECRPEFQRSSADGTLCGLSSQVVSQWYADHGYDEPPAIEDLWVINVEEAVDPGSENLANLATYSPIYDNGEPLMGITLPRLIAFLVPKFLEHRELQRKLVAMNQNRSKTIKVCGVDGCKNICGACMEHGEIPTTTCQVKTQYEPPEPRNKSRAIRMPRLLGDSNGDEPPGWQPGRPKSKNDKPKGDNKSKGKKFTPHLGERTKAAITKISPGVNAKLATDSSALTSGVDLAVSTALLIGGAYFCKHWSWTMVFPTTWYQKDWFISMFMATQAEQAKRVHRYGIALATLCLFLCSMFWYRWKSIILIHVVLYSIFVSYLNSMVRAYFLYRLRKSDCLPACIKAYRDTHFAQFARIFGGAAAVYGLTRLILAFRKNKPQSFMSPSTEEVKERDGTRNVWAAVHRNEVVYKSEVSHTVTSESMMGILSKNLMHASMAAPNGKTYMSNTLFMSTGIFVLPMHYFEHSDSFVITFLKHSPEKVGNSFSCPVHKNDVVKIPDTDLCLGYCPAGGSFRDLSKHLPVQHLSCSGPLKALWRTSEGLPTPFVGSYTSGKATNHAKHDGKEIAGFHGGVYTALTPNTFEGMCGAPVVSNGSNVVLLGFHLGGVAGSPQGCFGTITLSEYTKALEEVTKPLTRVKLSSQAGLSKEILGKSYILDQPTKAKSPVNFLPEKSQLKYLGPCIGSTTTKNLVVDHVISPSIALECGKPNKYMGPKITPQWEPWQKCLSNVALPATPFSDSLLERCAQDYVAPLCEVAKDPFWSSSTPLSEKENINGIPGVKFIDAMKLSTSVGFPLTGKKSQFIENLDEIGERRFTETFREHLEACEKDLREGVRLNLPAKACIKMEVLSKPKARIFYSCPTTLVALTRKYFLPVARLMQMHPALSECAVGLNAHSKEWEELMVHALAKGIERILAGDYSNYDQKLPLQLIIAAMMCMIEIASHMTYTADDLAVMRGLVSELAMPLVAFNGDLVEFMSGGWISGTAITVHVNGICGALNQRYVFFSTYPEAKSFRDHVVLLTYGDDNIGSVDAEHTKFNIKTMSTVLAEYGQKYTMPDKESAITEFLPLEDVEFLKRKSVFIPEINAQVGALVEDSIFKSLHCRVKDKSSPLGNDEAAAINIDGALREFFNHGRDVYETRRSQLKNVAEHHKIGHLCPRLALDFDDQVSIWFSNYGTEEERLNHRERAEKANKIGVSVVDPEQVMDYLADCDTEEDSS